jgi:RimJ/RimL family protein N-acetyltransferase
MEPLSRDKAKIMFNQLLNEPNGVYFGIIKKDNEGIIGYVFLAHILKSHKIAREFGIVIGDRKLWGHGYGSEATKLMLEYGFKHLKLHRIELLVLDSNKRALRMYRSQGFVQEETQREARLIEDKWCDVILLAVLEKEYFQHKELDCVSAC